MTTTRDDEKDAEIFARSVGARNFGVDEIALKKFNPAVRGV